jgi:hypothetical protein
MWNSLGFGRFAEKDPYLRLAWRHSFLVLAANACSKRSFLPAISTRAYTQDWSDLSQSGHSDCRAAAHFIKFKDESAFLQSYDSSGFVIDFH